MNVSQQCRCLLSNLVGKRKQTGVTMEKPWQDKFKYEAKEDTTGFGQTNITSLTNEEKEKLSETSDNTFQITDQFGELLLECEVGDKYHKLILQEGLNKILEEAVKHWELEDEPEVTEYKEEWDDFKTAKKGEVGGKYVVEVEEDTNGDAIINLPDELMKTMGWGEGDDIDIDVTDNLFDDFEVPSIVLRNLTKERNDEN